MNRRMEIAIGSPGRQVGICLWTHQSCEVGSVYRVHTPERHAVEDGFFAVVGLCSPAAEFFAAWPTRR